MKRYIISVTSKDRSGIVAGITEGVFRLAGNVEAASQTVHQGYFAMILLVTFAEVPTSDEIADAISAAAGSGLHVYSTPYDAANYKGDVSGSRFVVTCVGPDKPGILRTLTSFLAVRDVNIDDLYCTVDKGSFVVICQVTIPESIDILVLQNDLGAEARSGGFVSTLQHENVFEHTNQP